MKPTPPDSVEAFSKRARCEEAFTILEILVVVTLLAILAALLVAGVSAVQRMGDRARCASNLRNLGSIIHLYAADQDGDLVPSLNRRAGSTSGDTWMVTLNNARMFDRGPRRGNQNWPSWHMDPRGIMTCPSLETRQSGHEKLMDRQSLSAADARASFYNSSGMHYAMFTIIAGRDNRRQRPHQRPWKLNQFEKPGLTPIVGESNYEYLISPSNASNRAHPHRGMNLLYLDGSVLFVDGELPLSGDQPEFFNPEQ